jgi:NAD(P)H-hydrate epimerase
MGCAVEADETVTFAYPKTGILTYPGAGYAGKVYVEDISIPPAIIERFDVKANTLTDSEAGSLLPVRKRRSNKGDYGKVLVFAGSNEMPGAAALATSACYMAGGGLVCACVLPKVAQVIHHWQREATTRIVLEENGLYCKKSLEPVMDELSKASAIVLGPGIGRSPKVTEFVLELISAAKASLVLDADALFALSEDLEVLKTLKAPCIITPHPGEMSRLTGLPVAEILNTTIETAVRFSKDFNVVTLLKDASTIIAAPDGSYYINTTGNSALSKAGSGDVLCGIIAGFIAQNTGVFTAGVLGAYIHGKAGEAAALQKSLYGVTASDLLEYVPSVINELITTNYGRIYHE